MTRRVRTLRCPNCGEVIFENSGSCRTCGRTIEPDEASALADYEDAVGDAVSSASSADIAANATLGIYVANIVVFWLFARRFGRISNPNQDPGVEQTMVLGVQTVFAFVVLPMLVVLPVQVRRWRRRFTRLTRGHVDLEQAHRLILKTRNKWIAVLIIWVHLNVVPALLLLGRALGFINGG